MLVKFGIESEHDSVRSRMFTHGDAQFTWTQGSGSGHVCIPAEIASLGLINS